MFAIEQKEKFCKWIFLRILIFIDKENFPNKATFKIHIVRFKCSILGTSVLPYVS